VIPACGALWAAINLQPSYFFYDEWGMVDRVLHMNALKGTMASWNGHLWMLQYWLYRGQVDWFGVNSHIFVSAVFVGSLIGLHLSLAALLSTSGMSSTTSLFVGGLLTYLGAASQNFIYAIQNASALSLGTSVAAAVVAMGRPKSPRHGVIAAVLMLASVGIDSAVAMIGVALAAIVLVLRWRRIGVLAAAPSIMALIAWSASGKTGGQITSFSVSDRAVFAWHLLLRALGAALGQGERVGAVLLLASLPMVVIGILKRWINGNTLIMLIAGAVSTGVALLGLAMTRSNIAGLDFVYFYFNRYLQLVALPATLALVPALTVTARSQLARHPTLGQHPVVNYIAPLLTVMAFLLGLQPLRLYQQSFLFWKTASHQGVRSAAIVIRDGCPSGSQLMPSSQPLGSLDPLISTQLLQELIERGALKVPSEIQPQAAVVAQMCMASSTKVIQGRDESHPTLNAQFVEGSLDLVENQQIAGWAWDGTHPDNPIEVEIYDGITLLARVPAALFRQDLLDARKGNGVHGFFYPNPFATERSGNHTIRVLAAGKELAGSPKSVIK
jgi:hypothetical protein